MGQSFLDQFSADVDSKTNILEVVNFFYLKGVLSKDAQESIRGLLITNENYSIALKILREHYANKHVLISSYMESFVKLQPVTPMKNVSGLIAMYDLFQGNVRNLSSLGVPSGTCDKLLVHLLIGKISHSLRLVNSREFDDKVLDFFGQSFGLFQKIAFCKGMLHFVS